MSVMDKQHVPSDPDKIDTFKSLLIERVARAIWPSEFDELKERQPWQKKGSEQRKRSYMIKARAVIAEIEKTHDLIEREK